MPQNGGAYFACTVIQPFSGVRICDSSSNLQTAWPSPQSFLRGLVVAWTEFDNVPTSQAVIFIQLSEVSRRLTGEARLRINLSYESTYSGK